MKIRSRLVLFHYYVYEQSSYNQSQSVIHFRVVGLEVTF